MRSVATWFATVWIGLSLGVRAAPAVAEDLLPPEREIHEVIDHYIDAHLADRGVTPASQASDANLIRRLTLDLAGRIPTLTEAQAYVESQEPDKRARLVDRLMAAPSFARHQTNEFDAMLMKDAGGSIRPYLLAAMQENRGWDQVFRQIMLPGESGQPEQQATEFIRRRVSDVDKLTNDVSVLFFGVNISCAKCHDHPLVDAWKQQHFYGMTSFFNRTFENGGFLGERDYGVVKYKTTSGEEHVAKLMFLSGTLIDEPEASEPSDEQKKEEKKRLEELQKAKQPPPPPQFSRRAQLVDVALGSDGSHFFARAIVNRLFYRLLGQGLVMPVDQMHEGNGASHPELLAWLARDLQQNGYDLRRLVRGIVMSQAYSRASAWDGEQPPDASLFAVAKVRPLMPQQLGTALQVASNDPRFYGVDVAPDELGRRLEQAENAGRGLAGTFETPGEDFQVSVSEALWFSNNQRAARDLLGDGKNRLVGCLLKIEDPAERVRTAFWTVLSRPPAEEEISVVSDYVAQRSDRPAEAWQQVVWALLAGSEFRFNY